MDVCNSNDFIVLVLGVFLAFSCRNETSAEAPFVSKNPNRCKLTDVGEAADFVQTADIQDDALVVAHGIGNPQALVWRDTNLNKTFYLARVMGTQKKLYFLKSVKDDETPGVPTRFEGHLLRFDHLEKSRAREILSGLKSQYNVTIVPDQTYIILQGEKPVGCR